MILCCARGSVKRPDLRSNGSRRFCEAAMASCCQRLARFGVLSMRKPAGQSACPSTCATSFRFDERRVTIISRTSKYLAFSSSSSSLKEFATAIEDGQEDEDEAEVEHWALSVKRWALQLPTAGSRPI